MSNHKLAISEALIEYSAQRQYAKASSSCLDNGAGWHDAVQLWREEVEVWEAVSY
jgi:hypothetical protein